MSRDWTDVAERGVPVALRVIRAIALHAGRPAGRALLYPITAYFVLTGATQRRASRDYLLRVLGREPRWTEVFMHVYSFAATVLDRVFFLTDRFELFDLRVFGKELIIDAVESGRGSILLGAHVGSFEALRMLGINRGKVPLRILMNTGHNSVVTQLLDALNPEISTTVIATGQPHTMLRVKEALDAGYLVGTLGDRLTREDLQAGPERTVRCDFLGSEATFPAGQVLLASVMHAPVILMFGLYRGGNRYDVHFELLTDEVVLRRGQRMDDAGVWVRRYVARLEHYVRLAPCNWFNFYDFWNE